MQNMSQIACDNLLFCYRTVLDALNRSTRRNGSEREELFRVFWEEYEASRNDEIPTSNLSILLIIYIILILFGAFGSGLVMFVILRKQSMRSRGNLFILNLAISDLTLCLFTQPFNLLRLLTGHRNWMLGQFMCKFSATFQGTNVFVSTISITAIALDRFQCIIHPTISRQNNQKTIRILYTAWIGSFILASPLAYFSRTLELNKIQCVEIAEDSDTQLLKVIYSLGALILQYIAPLLIVSITYSRICFRIHNRYREMTKRHYSRPVEVILAKSDDGNSPPKQETQTKTVFANSVGRKSFGICLLKHRSNPIKCHSSNQHRHVNRRHRKAILLLASIAIIFSLSWLPLNLMNVIIDFRSLSILHSLAVIGTSKNVSAKISRVTGDASNFRFHPYPNLGDSEQLRRTSTSEMEPSTLTLIQFICLLLILSSACLNPILYGWLNDNFRVEFCSVWKQQIQLFGCSQCRPIDPEMIPHRIPSYSNYPNTSINEREQLGQPCPSRLCSGSFPQMKKLQRDMELFGKNPTFVSKSLNVLNETGYALHKISSMPNLYNCSMDKLVSNKTQRKITIPDIKVDLVENDSISLTRMPDKLTDECDSLTETDNPVSVHKPNGHHNWLPSVTSV